MSDPLTFSLFAAILSSFSIFVAIFVFVRNSRLRETVYLEKLRRVDLDKTREAFEQEISRLHEEIYKEKGRFKELNHLLLDSAEKQQASLPVQTSNVSDNDFLRQMGVEVGTSVEEKFVFVLTPFTSSEQKVYDVIRNTCNNLGLTVRRGDEKQIIGSIFPHILKEIAKSWLIIANLNDRNPNVFYELGIAQVLGKPCILVGHSSGELPFDLSHQQVVIYNQPEELRTRLTESISRIALGGNQSPMRSYASRSVPQEMMIQLVDELSLMPALRILNSHEDIDEVHSVGDGKTLLVKGRSNSRQFISDVGAFLRSRGIETGVATLISADGLSENSE